ncbi:IS66 family insertion sequence element accessory protein TnpA [Arcticibacter tournemirensis]
MKAEVERWRQSGLSQRAFCQELGMKVGTFAYWVSRTKEEEKKKGFIPLVPPQGSMGTEVEINYPNGVRIKVSTFDVNVLSRLIHLY